ncbi:helix-turn-helix domain-containing protein [Leifsonia sp. NPDC056824]|uniref:helix-turn-helix domain-containing protein n=1 Tax=Leifsonia sp. NPDC056824 TaxID=3345953 RepID=UPI003698BB8A
MSIQTNHYTGGPDPRYVFTMADRIQKAIRDAGLKKEDVAERLGVHSNTIGNWVNGRSMPKGFYLKQLALMTQHDADWLATGKIPEDANMRIPD